MIVVAGDIFINEGKRAQAIADMIAVAHGTQQEAGCIRYNFYADLETSITSSSMRNGRARNT